jgi:drug/metabolite transporter (DMT)-like permease
MKPLIKYALILSLVSLVWAGSFIVVKIGTKTIQPIHLGFLRFLVATPVMFLLLFSSKKRRKIISLQDLPATLLLSLTGVTLLYILQFTGIKYTAASTAAVLINTNVMFIAILSFIFLKEKFTIKKTLGIILGFSGATIIVSKGYFQIGSNFFGDILILLSAICWAVYSIVGKKLLEKYDSLTITTYVFALGTMFFIPFVAEDLTKMFYLIPLEGWLIILYLGLLCSVFGYIAWYYALSHMEASKAAIFLNLIPLFAILLSLLIGETITIFLIVGAICIIYGIYLTERG